MEPVSEKREPGYLHAWKGLAFVVVLLALFAILGSYMLRPGMDAPLQDQNSASEPVSTTPGENPVASAVPAASIQNNINLRGSQICLSHKDTSGPQTMECAIGFKADDGGEYGLDMSSLPPASSEMLYGGARVRITGRFTPAESLPESRYAMRGVILVSSVEPAP